MLIQAFAMNELGTNTYVVGVPGGDVVVIDPSAVDMTPVTSWMAEQGCRVVQILNTHCHFDHVLGNESMRALYHVPLWIPEAELPLLRNTPARVKAWFGYEVATSDPDAYLVEGDTVSVGPYTFHIMSTPGHSPGGVCFYEKSEGVLISGDTLFAGTVGRTDLEGSDPSQLRDSLRDKLWPLPDSVRVYPGHGDETTIGDERMVNPYFHFS